MLISDDRVTLNAENGRLIAMAPPGIAGKLEVRSVGIIDVPYRERAEVRLLVDLAHSNDIQRMPEFPPPSETVNGISLPRISLYPFEASAPIKLWLALYKLGA